MKLKPSDKKRLVDPHSFPLSLPDVKQIAESEDIILLGSNENNWGASPMVVRALRSCLQSQHRYPEGTAGELITQLSNIYNLHDDEFLVGNGSSEILELIIREFVGKGDEVITSHPSFHLYGRYVSLQGGENFIIPLKKNSHDLESIKYGITEKTRLIILDNPNNPTGSAFNPADLYQFLSDIPESVIVVLDEAYAEFMAEELQLDIFSLIRNTKNRCGVIVVKTFSKLYGLAGLRVGYAVVPVEISKRLQNLRTPFNVNMMAMKAALAALADKTYYENVRDEVRSQRDTLMTEFEKKGCTCLASQANFLFVDVGGDSEQLCLSLITKGVVIRSLKSYGFSHCVRVTIGKKEENNQLLEAFSKSMQELQYV